jgi:tetratricopeptide (TPR) repeat protein
VRVEAWNNKGSTRAMLGKYKESIECYDKVLEINPNNKTAQNNKMLSYQNLEFEE